MSLGGTVGCSLSAEVPSFHDTLETLTFRGRLHVNILANAEVLWTQHVANGQEAFWSDHEFGEVLLWRQAESEEVSSLGLLKLPYVFFAAPDLYRVTTISLLLFNLNDLAPVDL